MSLDADRAWIRADKLDISDRIQMASTGVNGDPTEAMPEMSRIHLEFNLNAAVAQAKALGSARC